MNKTHPNKQIFVYSYRLKMKAADCMDGFFYLDINGIIKKKCVTCCEGNQMSLLYSYKSHRNTKTLYVLMHLMHLMLLKPNECMDNGGELCNGEM